MLGVDSSLTASIIIPTYNRASLLDATLAALARQDISPDTFEIIIADDGSSDNTGDIVKKYENGLRLKYVYHSDHGYMVARVRNFGIRLAESPICVFLDCGNLVGTSFVQGHIDEHRNGEREAVIGYLFGFDHTNDAADRVLSILDEADIDTSLRLMAANELLDIRESFYASSNDRIDRFAVAWRLFWGGNISLRTNFVREIGGFDEWYRSWGVDDIDLGLTAKLAGAHFVLNRKAAAIQFPHPKDGSTRLVSHSKNLHYLHSKFRLPETEVLSRDGPLTEFVLESLDK